MENKKTKIYVVKTYNKKTDITGKHIYRAMEDAIRHIEDIQEAPHLYPDTQAWLEY